MDTAIPNTAAGFVIAAAIVIATFVLAHYAFVFLQKMIEKEVFGPLPKDRGNVLRIPGFFRLFIICRGLLLAFNQLQYRPATAELADVTTIGLAALGNFCLFVCLAIALKTGFDQWAKKSLDVLGYRVSGVKRVELLVKGLIIPLGILIVLPTLNLAIPEQEILFAAAGLFVVIAVLLISAIAGVRKETTPAENVIPAKETGRDEQQMIAAGEQQDPDFQLIIDIVALFLDVMKHNLGAGPESHCRYKLVRHDQAAAKYLFDLEIRLHSNRQKRRITVGRLAADSGSRSKCFYVIHNEYLVVKIPPVPITDPLEYHESLKVETDLAAKIDMEACIIPSIAVILKYADPAITRGGTIETPEELAMTLLRRRPECYRFLQVGGKFAYFMDLSKYHFLEKVIKDLHHEEGGGKVPFLRLKGPLEGLIANLLDLLAHLNEKGVAMRDLKPDNMLLAGDTNNYPGFLSTSDEYVAGLIDIETGVVIGNPPLRWIAQPLLSGTPRYATPSHFFNNKLIGRLYEEVADILLLQDWHSMLTILFKTLTQEYLFGETARTIPLIVKTLHTKKGAEDRLVFAIQVSRHFWEKADDEFKRKIDQHRETLEELQIRLSPTASLMFVNRLNKGRYDLQKAIKDLLNLQPLSTKDAQTLLRATAAETQRFVDHWRKLSETREDLQKSRPQTLRFLEKLVGLKLDLKVSEEMLLRFKDPKQRLSAQTILEAMFTLVEHKMNRRKWKRLTLKSLQELINLADAVVSKSLEEETTRHQTLIESPSEEH